MPVETPPPARAFADDADGVHSHPTGPDRRTPDSPARNGRATMADFRVVLVEHGYRTSRYERDIISAAGG
ncbi:MAG: hypothetical protein PVJ27_03300, partial [Candidatus Brocadiaceae bacterium]